MTQGYRLAFADDFDGSDLDFAIWVPHYLPMWSSRELSRATYSVEDSCLTLRIPPEQGLWCAGVHEPPLRVSAVQSGNFSGPVGSTIGQQPVVPGAVVQEEQPAHWGWTPDGGHLEMRARALVSPRSMVAFWLVGWRTSPTVVPRSVSRRCSGMRSAVPVRSIRRRWAWVRGYTRSVTRD